MNWHFGDFRKERFSVLSSQPTMVIENENRERDIHHQLNGLLAAASDPSSEVCLGGNIVIDVSSMQMDDIAPLKRVLSAIHFEKAQQRLVALQIDDYPNKASDRCFSMANRYLVFMTDILGGHAQPSVSPLPDGSAIAFEWKHKRRELLVEIDEGGGFEYLLTDNGVDVDEGENHGINILREHAAWLIKGGKLQTTSTTESN